MARLMVFNECFPADMSSGRDLRVSRFCAELAQRHDCFFVSFPGPDPSSSTPYSEVAFNDVVVLDEFRDGAKSFGRHFRTSNVEYMKRAWPAAFAATARQVGELQRRWNADAAINFTANLSALVLPLPVPKLLDRTDCDTLTLERRLAHRGSNMSFSAGIQSRIDLLRERRRERALVNGYDAMTTISEPDRQRFLELGRAAPEKITVVQNGVSEDAIRRGASRGSASRSVVFWGNMDFAPNWTAVNFFYQEVFQPYLAEQGLTFYIVGRGGDRILEDVSADPRVKRLGFVADLFEFLADKGVAVNPMVEGSGLKNKVLEAFALRLPVISTSLGVDALPVTGDRHLAIADDPLAFSAAVMRCLDDDGYSAKISTSARQFVEQYYSWQRIRNQFAMVVDDFLDVRECVGEPAAARFGADQ